MFQRERQPRYRLMAMAPELMLERLFSPYVVGGELRGVVVEGLPENVEVETVWWDEGARCFVFRLYSPAFDVVPAGQPIPAVTPTVRRATPADFATPDAVVEVA